MNIPNKTLAYWKSHKEEGDISLLAKETRKSEPTVYRIFKDGKAKVEDVEIINAFYKKRAARARRASVVDQD